MLKVSNKNNLFLMLTLNIFHTFFLVFLLLKLNKQMFAGKAKRQIKSLMQTKN